MPPDFDLKRYNQEHSSIPFKAGTFSRLYLSV
jgi:hypothetical protein